MRPAHRLAHRQRLVELAAAVRLMRIRQHRLSVLREQCVLVAALRRECASGAEGAAEAREVAAGWRQAEAAAAAGVAVARTRQAASA